jgi:eukaryotic-like serine/threonine-protein kinase
MATVWIAEDPVLARRVAVKVLHAELGVNEALRTRFHREAVAAARLSHSGIVATYDTGEDDGVAYIVMELVEGKTVRKLLDSEGALPVSRAVDLAVQVCDALQHAHQQGLVHRDVKPGNVLVTHHDRVKVTDFGIAKVAGNDDLTKTGTVIGTARYLAPEQVNGGEIDARTDVYALGLLVYEMMCGSPPFAAETDMATAVARLTNDPPSMRTYRPEISPELDAVVVRALARDPDRRFASAVDFRRALAASPRAAVSSAPPPPSPKLTLPATTAAPTEAGTRTSVGAPPVTHPPSRPNLGTRPPRSRRWLLLVLGALLLAGLGIAASLMWPFDDGDGSDGTSAVDTATPLTIMSVTDFDPDPGDGEEHAEETGNVNDGDPSTEWSSETYNSEDFGGRKDGVGLILELDAEYQITGVNVASAESGWGAQIYVSASGGESLDAWGAPVSEATDVSADPSFALSSPTTGRYVLLWFTDLPPSGRLGISEVTVEGLA